MSSCVLITDIDAAKRERVVSLLGDEELELVVASDHAAVLQVLSERSIDLLVTPLPSPCSAGASATSEENQSGGSDNESCSLETEAARTAAVLRWMSELRRAAPNMPVVLLTNKGMEPVACEALLRGAASYVPVESLEESLSRTVEQVLKVSRYAREAKETDQCISRVKLELDLPSEDSLVPSVIAKLERTTGQLELFDEMVWTQVAMALDEAILNAMIHGNLEVDSELREVDDGQAYWDLIAKRRGESPYAERRTKVTLTATRSQAVFVIRDQGPGYDLSSLPDPDDPLNLESIGGRGMMLIAAFMDEIHHNETGNEITMIKRKAAGSREE